MTMMMMMMILPLSFCIFLPCFSSLSSSSSSSSSSLINASFNLTLPHQHPYPELVAQEVHRRVNESVSRRKLLAENEQCLTGNPIDDCWRCDPDWQNNRQHLADCGMGFGQGAMGGKGGLIYTVTDSSDLDAANPKQGTLRYGVIQTEPLWIVFAGDMTIGLKHELIFNSHKTVDGRGANVHITGNGCITLQYVTNVIIHNVQISNCQPSGNTLVRSSPAHAGWRGRSDGDGISMFTARNIWIDHCALSSCTDGLIDAIMGSTAITISNSYFSHHNEVMLLGHVDTYLPDSGMQVTIAFNHFGEGCVQRMPRCRRGYIHVVNNDYTEWQMYAIGGSARPTINSQGNRYIAPDDPNAKEVTKRVETVETDWSGWNWRTEGDMLVNGAFFVPSGDDLSNEYTKASSLDSHSALLIDQLTAHSGVIPSIPTRENRTPLAYGGGTTTGANRDGNVRPTGGRHDDNPFGFPFGGGAPPSPPPIAATLFLLSLLIITLHL